MPDLSVPAVPENIITFPFHKSSSEQLNYFLHPASLPAKQTFYKPGLQYLHYLSIRSPRATVTTDTFSIVLLL